MAALTSGSWTITFRNAERGIDTSIGTRHKFVQATWTIATGESPAAGIPWPDKGKLGFVRQMDNVIISNIRGATGGAATASGTYLIWEMNVTGQKARALKINYTSGNARSIIALPTTVTIKGGSKLYVTAIGW